MQQELALDEVAAAADETTEQLRRWQELGLLSTEPSLPVAAVDRVRLIRYAIDHGIDAGEIVRICEEQGDLLDLYVAQLQRPGRGQTLDLDEAASQLGVSPDLLERIRTASGMREQMLGYEEDIEALRSVGLALELGLPEEVLLQLIRVLATSQAKVADAANRLVHFYVHEAFRADGLRGTELMNATRRIADPISGLLEPAVLYFHRKAWERALVQDMILHLREEANPPSTIPGEVDRTVLFVDLSRFTPLSEAMGDAAAADVLERFGEMVRHWIDRSQPVVKRLLANVGQLTFDFLP